jgi:hypothetical protein
MGTWRSGQIRWIARLLTLAGSLLLLAGAAVGWLLPGLARAVSALAFGDAPLARSAIDSSSYLGADITALAVIIAVVIGFNATTLQIAGQTHSLALVRAILLSLTPFLACWSLTTAVALLYFLLPPVFVVQLWQMLCWFGATVLLMVAYLWDLPWRLSGQYVGLWAIRGLARRPIREWESLDGFSALQTSVASASLRGDLGTVRAIARVLGRFLVGVRDAKAEAENTYDRGRYRAIKNLLGGCAQNMAQAPNSVAYYLGFIEAGVLLQAVAMGHVVDDPDHDLFSSVLRAARGAPERLNALWTGLRHALCRGVEHDEPFLLHYWFARPRWTSDDPRRATDVAEGLAWFHSRCWRELRAVWPAAEADNEALQMLDDLYRDIAVNLAKHVARERRQLHGVRLTDLPLTLLDKVHATVLRTWPMENAESVRVSVVNAYEARREQLLALFGPAR